MDLRKMMDNCGLGVVALAGMTGISVPSVYAALRSNNVALRTIKVLALFFGYSIALRGADLDKSVYSIAKKTGMSNKTIKDALALSDNTRLITLVKLSEGPADIDFEVVKNV